MFDDGAHESRLKGCRSFRRPSISNAGRWSTTPGKNLGKIWNVLQIIISFHRQGFGL